MNIVHTYIGDLVVSLIAPDGTTYVLHNRTGGATDNINQTYTVNLSTETSNGAWKLQVQDAASGDTGYINTWTLKLGDGHRHANLRGGTNGTDVTIPDNTTVEQHHHRHRLHRHRQPDQGTVAVNIVHTYIGDLVVSLIAPDGTACVLHNRTGSSTDNINQTYTVNLSTETRNGTWTLGSRTRHSRHRLHQHLDHHRAVILTGFRRPDGGGTRRPGPSCSCPTCCRRR